MKITNEIELYQFTCHWCSEGWNGSYQVRTVLHQDGEPWAMYWNGGSPCEAPAAADVLCRACHRGGVEVRLRSRTDDTTPVIH